MKFIKLLFISFLLLSVTNICYSADIGKELTFITMIGGQRANLNTKVEAVGTTDINPKSTVNEMVEKISEQIHSDPSKTTIYLGSGRKINKNWTVDQFIEYANEQDIQQPYVVVVTHKKV